MPAKTKKERNPVDSRLEEAADTAIGAFTAAILGESERVATARTKSGFSIRVQTKDGKKLGMRIGLTDKSANGSKKKSGGRKKTAAKKKAKSE